MVHVATCIWNYMDTIHYNKETTDEWINSIEEHIEEHGNFGNFMDDVVNKYVNSFYFITTIMTTVGYGDTINKGKDSLERFYLMFVIFGGIAMFTLITQQVLSFRHVETVDDLVADNTEELNDFLYCLS